jgi:Zn-dependent peptidase ImmA (M78 family)
MGSEYEQLKVLARQKRQQYGVETTRLNLCKVRSIYKQEGITIDLWELSPRIRAMYMCDDGDPSVLVNRTLPKEPRLFSMIHELKHHFVDRLLIEEGKIECDAYNANRQIEVGAEIFAAEFIFPEEEFLACALQIGLPTQISPEDIVRFKRECRAPVSYTFLQKRFEFLGLIKKGQFKGVRFQKLEEELYGVAIYKQEWFRRRRARDRL